MFIVYKKIINILTTLNLNEISHDVTSVYETLTTLEF